MDDQYLCRFTGCGPDRFVPLLPLKYERSIPAVCEGPVADAGGIYRHWVHVEGRTFQYAGLCKDVGGEHYCHEDES
jgi:hypothetical protein